MSKAPLAGIVLSEAGTARGRYNWAKRDAGRVPRVKNESLLRLPASVPEIPRLLEAEPEVGRDIEDP